MMRPRAGRRRRASRSIASEPVESVSTFILVLLPRRMIEPSPNCLVMEESGEIDVFFAGDVGGFLGRGDAGSDDLDFSALDMTYRVEGLDALRS